ESAYRFTESRKSDAPKKMSDRKQTCATNGRSAFVLKNRIKFPETLADMALSWYNIKIKLFLGALFGWVQT
ncbi:MAG: hypothetical protein IJD11_02415, partial [Oscillospiraceae bacterium]|nr:hypothetical protein [Oscillospiraceae bacterium]